MDKTITQLTQAGLTEKEANVYHAGLLLGSTTALKLARQTGLKRATVYTVIDALVDKGLMRQEEVGLKSQFVAEDPGYLRQVMERKMDDVATVIPELETLYKKHGQDRTIKVYEGIKAVSNVGQLLIDNTKTGDFRYFIGGDIGWQKVDSKYQERFFKWRERINLDARLLFQDSKRATQHQNLAGALRQSVKVLPKPLEIKSDIIITPKFLVLQKLSTPVTAVVIEDEEIIATYKALFLFIWNIVSDDNA